MSTLRKLRLHGVFLGCVHRGEVFVLDQGCCSRLRRDAWSFFSWATRQRATLARDAAALIRAENVAAVMLPEAQGWGRRLLEAESFATLLSEQAGVGPVSLRSLPAANLPGAGSVESSLGLVFDALSAPPHLAKKRLSLRERRAAVLRAELAAAGLDAILSARLDTPARPSLPMTADERLAAHILAA